MLSILILLLAAVIISYIVTIGFIGDECSSIRKGGKMGFPSMGIENIGTILINSIMISCFAYVGLLILLRAFLHFIGFMPYLFEMTSVEKVLGLILLVFIIMLLTSLLTIKCKRYVKRVDGEVHFKDPSF